MGYNPRPSKNKFKTNKINRLQQQLVSKKHLAQPLNNCELVNRYLKVKQTVYIPVCRIIKR